MSFAQRDSTLIKKINRPEAVKPREEERNVMYAESKKILDKIRSKDEVMFRMAISHLMDVGIRHLTEENILET